jgi:alkaline phosphatase D
MTTRRREFLAQGLQAAAALAVGRPAVAAAVRRREAPVASWGASVGDVTPEGAIVWSRADRPARLLVEHGRDAGLAGARRVRGAVVGPATDFTGRVDLTGLPPGQRVFYRVRFQDAGDPGLLSEPVEGSFRTPPADDSEVSVAWGADTAGQGWGIDPAHGGMRTYESIRRAAPDLFLHVGDTIYADNVIKPEVALEDGSVWRNLTTPAKSAVAQTLADFRGNHLYNLLDENVRRCNAEVPVVATWDDHEVLNNWYPGLVLSDARYAERRVDVLSARALQAFLDYQPVRPGRPDPRRVYRRIPYGPLLDVFVLDLRRYRGPNGPNAQEREGPETALLGDAQVRWLVDGLRGSRARWKVVAISQPTGLAVPDGPAFDNAGNGNGAPRGRELEMARVLRSLRDAAVRNVVWLTGDVHYAAAHHYHPDRARFREFTPFWEFVAGPLHAGTFLPPSLDDTFGPEVRFCAVPAGMKPNRPPSEGKQFFGTARIAKGGRTLTVRLHDREGAVLFTQEIESDPA